MATDTPRRAPGPHERAGDAARTGILRYWHGVEMFSTGPAPRPGADGRVVEVEAGTTMPWSPAAGAARETLGEERVWRHAVYCGLFSLEEAYGALGRVFPPTDDDIFGVRASGEAALAAFVVDEDGFPVDGGHVLSECAWAIGRVLAGAADDAADGFAGAQAELGTLIAECGDGPLGAGDLHAVAEAVHALTGVAGHIDLAGVRVRTFHVDRATTSPGDGVLLNSFIADDLRRVAAAVGRGDYGHALWRYLAPDDEVDRDTRCDVEADRVQVSAALAPARIPAGRWPAPTGEPLATGQQLAVNEALHTLGHGGGILAVNGPPGTGKTTMLRDLIAAIVVDRATRLADLDRAEDVFAGALPWGRASSERRVWAVRPHLVGAEIVLACATNAAAENVTTEIPGVGAIGEEWLGEADHLSSLATLVLRAWHESAARAGTRVDIVPPRAWGLVAACLGSRQKGADFTGAFWWGRLPSQRRGARDGSQMRMPVGDGAGVAAQGLHRTLRAAVARGEGATPTWADAVATFRAAREAVESGRDAAAASRPDEDAWWADRTRRLRETPWVNAGWNACRTRLFLAALGLHRALMEHAAKPLAHNLRAAVDIISGRTPAGLDREAARAAWQTLFLVVPVVSTTFASLPRLFAHLGREDLGWLLIDEAGQAAPQQAVGAIWRARRAVVVGDPRQLEPIVSLPVATQEGLRTRRGVAARWVPSRTSVQRLADRVSRTGTYDGHGDGALWVGSPLTLHRRCEEPMFGIVNAMAYGGRMVNGTPSRDASPLPPSGWLDVVAGGPAEGHWVPAEGTRLDGVLAYLDHRGHDLSQVLVVSPFRDVARALRVHARRWPGVSAGTVHTAQGREADVVIVVLGGEPGRDGAVRWATRRPNLLNVAVSRARRRLWVIGDRDLWRRHPHAREIAARLPVKR